MLKLIDLFCGAGGCSMGYHLAAHDLNIPIEITGVDINPQPNYPFNFIQTDAIEYFKLNYHNFTHVHASPPCQQYSCSTSLQRKKGIKYSDLISDTRNLITNSKLPGIIENVQNSPLRPDIRLRGDMFGLQCLRVRIFETVNYFDLSPVMPQKIGSVRQGDFLSIFGHANLQSGCLRLKGHEHKTIKETWKIAMDISWMKTDKELSQAIPPAYTRYIGFNFFKNTIPVYKSRNS